MRERDIAEKLASGNDHIVAGATAGIADCVAERQRYWSELKEHERIDRLREVVKHLENRLEQAEAYIRALVEHRHDDGGHMVGPFDPSRHMPSNHYAQALRKEAESRGKQDDIYF